jgi:hypothetical protein
MDLDACGVCNSPRISVAELPDADSARAAKRAEIEQKVAALRAKIQQEKDIQQAAERERQRIEQEKEARKQFQFTQLSLNAQREKDEELAKALAQADPCRVISLNLSANCSRQIVQLHVADATESMSALQLLDLSRNAACFVIIFLGVF